VVCVACAPTLNDHGPAARISADDEVLIIGSFRSLLTGAPDTASTLVVGPSSSTALSRRANWLISVMVCAFSPAVSPSTILILTPPCLLACSIASRIAFWIGTPPKAYTPVMALNTPTVTSVCAVALPGRLAASAAARASRQGLPCRVMVCPERKK